MRADIAVRSATGEDILIVEVKARRGMDRRWAAQLHRNLKAHGMTEAGRFFLLVTPDEAYLWKEQQGDPERGPDATAATADLVDERLLDTTAEDGQAFELLVSAWVQSLVTATSSDDVAESARALVVDSGLFQELRNGAVLTQVA